MQRINKNRGCTDILFLALWVASWVGVVLIISMAHKAGADPYKLIYGIDMNGDKCGYGSNVGKTYVAWPNPAYYEFLACVDSCEATNNYGSDDPTTPAPGTRMAYRYESTSLGPYCLPTAGALQLLPSISVSWTESDITRQCTNAAADVATTWPAILASGGAALIITFIFVAFLGKCAGCVLLLAITFIMGGTGLISAFLIRYGMDEEHKIADPNTAKAALVCGAVLAAVIAIALCILLAMYTRIRIAVEVVKEAASAVGDMKTIICFPIFPFITAVVYVALWIVCMVYVFSVTEAGVSTSTPSQVTTLASIPSSMWNPSGGTNQNPLTYIPTYHTDFWKTLAAYLFFHLLWQIQFFYYFGYLTFAGATADWYFTERDSRGYKLISGEKGLGHCPVCRSCCRTLRYHLGTVAVASLIIAIIQFIRAVLLYIEKKTTGRPPNKLQQMVFCLIQCCLKCLQCCMDKINKNALIWVAITGDSFGTAACSSFMLLWSNIGRTLAIMGVSSVLVFITKVAVAAITTGVALAIFPRYYTSITSPLMPCILIFILSFIVCSVFMVVFNSIIDTIFLCFLIDEDVNAKAGQPMMASASLADLVCNNEELKQEAAIKEQQQRERYERLDGAKIAPTKTIA